MVEVAGLGRETCSMVRSLDFIPVAVGRVYMVRFAFWKGHCSYCVETGQEGIGLSMGTGSMERSRYIEVTFKD